MSEVILEHSVPATSAQLRRASRPRELWEIINGSYFKPLSFKDCFLTQQKQLFAGLSPWLTSILSTFSPQMTSFTPMILSAVFMLTTPKLMMFWIIGLYSQLASTISMSHRHLTIKSSSAPILSQLLMISTAQKKIKGKGVKCYARCYLFLVLHNHQSCQSHFHLYHS